MLFVDEVKAHSVPNGSHTVFYTNKINKVAICYIFSDNTDANTECDVEDNQRIILVDVFSTTVTVYNGTVKGLQRYFPCLYSLACCKP